MITDSDFNKLERCIRSGTIFRASKLLKLLLHKRPTRKQKLNLATISRRVHLPQIGLRLLKSFVRPAVNTKNIVTPFPEEVLEYCHCLIAINIIPEALELLESIDGKNLPQKLLTQAFAHIKCWQYDQAVPYLRDYCAFSSINDYQKLVGYTNLAQALVHEKNLDEGQELLDRLIPWAKADGHKLILTALYEFQIEHAINFKRWDLAEKFLGLSSLVKRNSSLERMYFSKIHAMLRLYKNRDRASLENILRVQAFAEKLGSWETIRDCDYHLALVNNNRDLFCKLWFGTPFDHYRNNLLKRRTWHEHEIPDFFVYRLGKGRKRPISVDVENGTNDIAPLCLKEGHVPQRLLETLLTDLYKPLTVSFIHTQLFPGRHYNVFSSPNTVYQAMNRLRLFFRESGLPLEMAENNGFFRLTSQAPVYLKIPNPRRRFVTPRVKKRDREFIELCRKTWGNERFRAHEVAKKLDISQNTAIKWLMKGIKAGEISRIGGGRSTFYTVLSS